MYIYIYIYIYIHIRISARAEDSHPPKKLKNEGFQAKRQRIGAI